MKSLHACVLLLGIFFFIQHEGIAQSITEQRVERYLFSSYDANKAGMKENDRLIAFLKKRLEEYTFSLKKEELAVMKEKEAAFNAYLDQVDEIKDRKKLEKMVEESKVHHKILISSIMEKGLTSLKEAEECQKVILHKIIELELMKVKNEKLVALLKDTTYRGNFISQIVSSGKIQEETDIKDLMTVIDKSLSDFSI